MIKNRIIDETYQITTINQLDYSYVPNKVKIENQNHHHAGTCNE